VVGMQKIQREWLKKNIVNYIEIYIETKISKIKKKSMKKTYKNNQNIVGIHIKPELPKKPDIKIINNFKKSTDFLSKQLVTRIYRLIDKK
jgi:adenylylsulfate kinase-like enzyme